jgi:hypothetical protein
VDILDQIDQALREVGDDGCLTDAMRWSPGASSDEQDADLMGRYGSDIWTDMIARYTAALDEGVLSPTPGEISRQRHEIADLFEVPPELLQTMAPPPHGVSGLYSAVPEISFDFQEPRPEHPLERVRWLRAQRGSGPPARQRAPRRIDPRGTR